jgi:hypothetical protein
MKLLLGTGLALLPLATPAAAQVLTADNSSYLCVPAGGEEVVDTDRLAYLIASEARADRYLDGANAVGQSDGVIQLRSSATAPSEPVYAVTHLDGNSEGPAQPFGPAVDLASDKAAGKARDSILQIMSDDLVRLIANRSVPAGPGLTYRLRDSVAVGSRLSEADSSHPNHLFGANPAYRILCDRTPVVAGQAEGGGAKPPAGPVAARLVLRGAVKDLAIAPGDLRDSTPAGIRFDRDGVSDTDTFQINGIVGLRIGHKSGAYHLIPYLSYENKSITGAGNDVEKLSPGLLFAHRYETPSLAVHSKLEISYIDDLQQDSRQGKLRLYVEPAFALGRGRGVLFGSYLKPIGPLWLRPDMTLIADASKVFRAGTSQELANAEDYYGFGGELGLRARLELGRPISDLSFKAGLRQLFMMGEINQEHVRRWYGSIEYAPKDFPYIGVSLQFSRGENDDTFQDEKTYGLGLTLRY